MNDQNRPLGGGAMMTSPTSAATKRKQQTHVYNAGYKGKTYAVKYLGIVDGAMGILSRKMAMPVNTVEGAAKPLVTGDVPHLPAKMAAKVQMAVPEWKIR